MNLSDAIVKFSALSYCFTSDGKRTHRNISFNNAVTTCKKCLQDIFLSVRGARGVSPF